MKTSLWNRFGCGWPNQDDHFVVSFLLYLIHGNKKYYILYHPFKIIKHIMWQYSFHKAIWWFYYPWAKLYKSSFFKMNLMHVMGFTQNKKLFKMLMQCFLKWGRFNIMFPLQGIYWQLTASSMAFNQIINHWKLNFDISLWIKCHNG